MRTLVGTNMNLQGASLSSVSVGSTHKSTRPTRHYSRRVRIGMIGLKSTLNCIDNSGALVVECVNILKNKVTNGWGSVGDEIVCVVKRARPVSAATQASVNAVKVRRGDVRRAVIVRTRKNVRRPDGSVIRFDDNAAVLLNNKREMLGTRIGGLVSADLRMKGWGKIVSLAPKVV
ncbi:ribosomal protein L14p/L23e-domain-containing protein [Crucibulum laeve]|uniref:Large ribosomal subunit protein uL14m n=1 Tax=Crucibulum laeve TaxID=68775 RepID=A0A5C3LFG9_9AGAR|nr:ribosomal protein L14p/L23e-domain-containing protein [Crucibulum laeve]